MTREEQVDPLIIYYPECPDCLIEVQVDDGFWCMQCGASWSNTYNTGLRVIYEQEQT